MEDLIHAEDASRKKRHSAGGVRGKRQVPKKNKSIAGRKWGFNEKGVRGETGEIEKPWKNTKRKYSGPSDNQGKCYRENSKSNMDGGVKSASEMGGTWKETMNMPRIDKKEACSHKGLKRKESTNLQGEQGCGLSAIESEGLGGRDHNLTQESNYKGDEEKNSGHGGGMEEAE